MSRCQESGWMYKFGRVWVADKELRVIGIWLFFKAMRLGEVTKGGKIETCED